MTYDTKNHQRRSLRLKDYAYSQEGAYFITICTHDKVAILGGIVDGAIRLNRFGSVVNKCWLEIPHHFPNVEIDTFVIMPNHFHGILVIHDCRGEVTSPTPKGTETAPLQKMLQNSCHSPSIKCDTEVDDEGY